jgi:hypothetical protein
MDLISTSCKAVTDWNGSGQDLMVGFHDVDEFLSSIVGESLLSS